MKFALAQDVDLAGTAKEAWRARPPDHAAALRMVLFGGAVPQAVAAHWTGLLSARGAKAQRVPPHTPSQRAGVSEVDWRLNGVANAHANAQPRWSRSGRSGARSGRRHWGTCGRCMCSPRWRWLRWWRRLARVLRCHPRMGLFVRLEGAPRVALRVGQSNDLWPDPGPWPTRGREIWQFSCRRCGATPARAARVLLGQPCGVEVGSGLP